MMKIKEMQDREKSASKIQKWFRSSSKEKQRYSVKVILYRCWNLDDSEDINKLLADTDYSDRVKKLKKEDPEFDVMRSEILNSSLEKMQEIFKRKKFKFFYKYIAKYEFGHDKFKIQKVLYSQIYRPCYISIKMTRNE